MTPLIIPKMTDTIWLFPREENIIELPRHSVPMTMHYGSQANYERFIGTAYFICDISYRPNIDDLDKHIDTTKSKKHHISEVVYSPDKLYQANDGYVGSCWKVTVLNGDDGTSATYSIRNWIDIVQYYLKKGFRFVEVKDF
jgi:hypothetical protein